MSDHTTNENADLESKLRTALRETAAQIEPKSGAVPAEATVTPLRRQNRAWMPALAAAAVVLLLVGVVTLINRGGGGETVAVGTGELVFYLPEGMALGPDTPSPSETGLWRRTIAPYGVTLWCDEYADGSCRSVVGSAQAFFAEDGTALGPDLMTEPGDPAYQIIGAFRSEGTPGWESLFDHVVADAGGEIVEVDINGQTARYVTGTDEPMESMLAWIVESDGDGQRIEVAVSGFDRPIEEVIEFARSLEPHTVPVPTRIPVQIADIDDLVVIAGAWDPPTETGNESNACISTMPYGERGSMEDHCTDVGTLAWWEIGDEDEMTTVPPDENPDDLQPALPPSSPSGIVVGTAPLGTAAVEVDFTLADGSTSTEVVEVVGAEYGFTAGFFVVDGGGGAAVLDVRILGPAPTSTDELLLYLPPDGYAGTGDPLAEARWYWTKEVESYGVDVWCDRFEAGACRSVTGAASAEFVSDTADDDRYTVRFTYLGDGTSAWAQAQSELEPPDGSSDVVLIGGVPGTHFPEASTVLVQPAENVLVEITGGDGDDVVDFADSLELRAAPIPEHTPVLIAEFDNLTAVAGAWGTTLTMPDPVARDGESDSSIDSAACVTVHSNDVFVDGPALVEAHCSTTAPGAGLSAGWNPDPDSFGAVTIDGIAPLGVAQLEVVVEFADGTTSTHLVDVVGADYGFTTGFWILRVPAPASITDVQYSIAGAG